MRGSRDGLAMRTFVASFPACLRGFPTCTASPGEFRREALSDCGGRRGSDGEYLGVTLPLFFTLPSATCTVGVHGENTATQPL